MYSGTPLNQTPLRPEEMSSLEGCPLYWGFIHKAVLCRILYCLTVSTSAWYIIKHLSKGTNNMDNKKALQCHFILVTKKFSVTHSNMMTINCVNINSSAFTTHFKAFWVSFLFRQTSYFNFQVGSVKFFCKLDLNLICSWPVHCKTIATQILSGYHICRSCWNASCWACSFFPNSALVDIFI